jgi:hypothetical protein
MNPGDSVRFKAHGETGLTMRIITRDGDDVTLQDPRGRLLTRTPIELLALVSADDEPTVRTEPAKCWREVDELEAY